MPGRWSHPHKRPTCQPEPEALPSREARVNQAPLLCHHGAYRREKVKKRKPNSNVWGLLQRRTYTIKCCHLNFSFIFPKMQTSSSSILGFRINSSQFHMQRNKMPSVINRVQILWHNYLKSPKYSLHGWILILWQNGALQMSAHKRCDRHSEAGREECANFSSLTSLLPAKVQKPRIS